MGGSGASLWAYLTSEDDGGDLGLERGLSRGLEKEYWFGSGQSHGDAIGGAAAVLGVSHIDRQQFLTLCEGKTLDGTQVIQRNKGKHVSGIDVVFSAPKSASILMATSTDTERQSIQAAWDASVLACFERMERDALTVHRRNGKREGGDGERIRQNAKLVGFVARHHTARPTEESEARGGPPDPHLHSHVFCFNMAIVETIRGQRWHAIDDYGIKLQAEAREYELQGEFARRLEELGYVLEYKADRRGRVSWEVAGIPDDAIEFFSSNRRRAQKLKADFEREKMRPPSEVELRMLMRKTRIKKAHEAESDPSWNGIVKVAAEAGIELQEIRHDHGEPVRAKMRHRLTELQHRLDESHGLCRDDATFSPREIRASVARKAVGLGLTFMDLDMFMAGLRREQLVRTQDAARPEHRRWTTRNCLRQERSIAMTLNAKRHAVHQVPSPDALERAARDVSHETSISLDPEQRLALEALCSTEGLVSLEAPAGAGKGTVLEAAVRALRDTKATGKPTADKIITISTAAETAQRTHQRIGTDDGFSIESFCLAARKNRMRPTDRTWLIVDEAVMVDTPRMDALLRAAGPAKIILVGDRRQAQCIGAGGWYPDQVKRHGKVELSKVWRHRHREDTEAFTALRNGDAKTAIESLDARGRIHVTDTPEGRIGLMVQDYIAHRDAGRSVHDVRIVFDGANSQIDSANRAIQTDRRHRGELSTKHLTLHSTDTDRTWEVYQGDEITFLDSYADDDKHIYVKNGTRGRVLDVHPFRHTAKIRLVESGEVVSIDLPAKAGQQMIGPMYASHVQKLQGAEAEVILTAPTRYVTSLQAGYSQLTRCIEEVHVYLDEANWSENPTEALAVAWQQSKEKVSAGTTAQRNGIEYNEFEFSEDDVLDVDELMAPSSDGQDFDPDDFRPVPPRGSPDFSRSLVD